MMTDLSLSIRGLTKRFGELAAVERIDLEVRHGEILALLGPSGCGKTTTLRMIAGLEQPTEGDIRFGERIFVSVGAGIDLPPEQRSIGMVFQSYALWPHLTVFENVAYPLRLRGVRRPELRERVGRVLALINLSGLADKTIPQLSGGQQQRVALARALVYEPSLMLFDEPFSNLDTQLRGQMRMELKALRRKVAMTGLFVTHDQVEALSLADQVAIMNAGAIEQVGPPQEVYRNPRTRFARDFLGRVVKLHGILEQNGSAVAVRLPESGTALAVGTALPAGVAVGSAVELAIRPEFIGLLGEDDAGRANSVAASVEDLLFTGERFEARMRIGRDQILFDLPPHRSWREGQAVRLWLPPEAVSVWPNPASSA